MRLPTDVRTRFLALGLTALLAACGRGGSDSARLETAVQPPLADQTGPSGDYPIVLGDPFTVDGKLYKPVDTLNYDEVGFASVDREGGDSVTVAHKTLPLPSYVEITALDTGRTILARAERRGPMTSSRLIALSPGARLQLGVAENAPVRVRRVNPPEADRFKLRSGENAPLRMETPASLLVVLNRKLQAGESTSLRAANSVAAPASPVPSERIAQTTELPPVVRSVRTASAAPSSAASTSKFDRAFSTERKAVGAYPLPPLGASRRTAPLAATTRPSPAPTAEPATDRAEAANGFVVQAAAFASKSNAERAATRLEGFVQQSGKFYRVRKGPFTSRGQAEAALAKVRAAGYRDARLFKAG